MAAPSEVGTGVFEFDSETFSAGDDVSAGGPLDIIGSEACTSVSLLMGESMLDAGNAFNN